MIQFRRKNINLNWGLLLAPLGISILTVTYLILGVNRVAPQRKVADLFLSNLSEDNPANLEQYWCFPENVFHRVSSWKFAREDQSKSMRLNSDSELEKMTATFPKLKSNLSRLARFEHSQLVYSVNASTKSGSNVRAKQWVFDVWEREKLLRYRKLAESILSEMYAEVENTSYENEELLNSINAAKYASLFAQQLANDPVFGDLDNLADTPYCIMSAKEVSVNDSESND